MTCQLCRTNSTSRLSRMKTTTKSFLSRSTGSTTVEGKAPINTSGFNWLSLSKGQSLQLSQLWLSTLNRTIRDLLCQVSMAGQQTCRTLHLTRTDCRMIPFCSTDSTCFQLSTQIQRFLTLTLKTRLSIGFCCIIILRFKNRLCYKKNMLRRPGTRLWLRFLKSSREGLKHNP